jgi:hypothetical protein
MIGILALGLTASAVHAPVYSRIRTSAQSFHRYFKDLKSAGSALSPLERFVFSLVLANTKAQAQLPAAAPPADRT